MLLGSQQCQNGKARKFYSKKLNHEYWDTKSVYYLIFFKYDEKIPGKVKYYELKYIMFTFKTEVMRN